LHRIGSRDSGGNSVCLRTVRPNSNGLESPSANRLHMALMAMWEITITCRDGSRLRFSELRGQAPKKGRDLRGRRRPNNQSEDRRLSRGEPEWLAPSLFPGHGDRIVKSADMKPRPLHLGSSKTTTPALLGGNNKRRTRRPAKQWRWRSSIQEKELVGVWPEPYPVLLGHRLIAH
jgi:hypothetical protein